MSADNQDLANRLLIQLAQSQPQQSIFGLAAPQSPVPLMSALAQINQQNAVPGPTPGPYGYLHDASTRGFYQLGQQMGNFTQSGNTATPIPTSALQALAAQRQALLPPTAGQASGSQAPTAGDPTQASPSGSDQTPAPLPTTMAGAIRNAKQIYQAQISAGVDPQQAQFNTLKYLAQVGVPGAADKLAAAQDALDKSAATKAGTAKDTAQAANYANESTNRDLTQARETRAATWTTTYTDPQGFFQIQTNGNGEHKRVELQPNIASLVQASPEQEANIAAAIKSGQLPPLSGPALRTPSGMRIMGMVTADGTYDATNWAAKAKAANSFAPGGSNAKTVNSMNVALSHLNTLSSAADALGNGDIKGVNQVANKISAWTGNTPPTDFDGIKGIVGDELTKAIIGSGGALADREEMKKTLDAANSPQQLQSVINRYQSLLAGQLAGQRTQYENATGRKDFEQRFLEPQTRDFAHTAKEYTSVFPNQVGPSGTTGQPQGASAPSTAALPLTNAQGWQLHTDKNGVHAYVGPGGQVQVVGQ